MTRDVPPFGDAYAKAAMNGLMAMISFALVGFMSASIDPSTMGAWDVGGFGLVLIGGLVFLKDTDRALGEVTA